MDWKLSDDSHVEVRMGTFAIAGVEQHVEIDLHNKEDKPGV